MLITITTVFAYLIVLAYFVVERALRKGERALSFQPEHRDQGSSYLLLGVGLVTLFLLVLAPVGNFFGIGYMHHSFGAWLGVLMMLMGLVLRYEAAHTLGEFYTRTLQVFEGHQIVEQGLYRVIRHPGYLGLSVMEIGAGLAVNNWIVLVVISLTGLISRLYRIRVEERMLERWFGEHYRIYVQKTWRLLPFFY